MPVIPTKFEELKQFVNTKEFKTIRDEPERLMLCKNNNTDLLSNLSSPPRSKLVGNSGLVSPNF
jgi:hypothetical protein